MANATNPHTPTPTPGLVEPRTMRMAGGTAQTAKIHDTDYQLSASVIMPAATVRLIEASDGRAPVVPSKPSLDLDTRALFQHRLRLCCLIATVPFGFLTACAATNFIDLFGRQAVGWTGLTLSVVTLVGLIATAVTLGVLGTLPERWLRAVEVFVFGLMATCFAFWQFQVLTTASLDGVDPAGRDLAVVEQSFVLAAALITHFNWFALVVFHGVLVPNTLARGTGVAVGLCLLAFAIDAVAVGSQESTRRHAGTVFAVSGTMLVAGAGLSIFGVAKTEALREEVRTAKEAAREMGQYRLRAKLGQGGMGEVYLAEHRLLKRPCALKRIHAKYLNNPEQIRRFEREVQATAKLRHPNTVEIYDYGRTEDGTFYYVMEYLPGMSLEELIARGGPIPADRVVHILRQVCGALREAHRIGLVHRDIKPSNILVLPLGSPHDQAKIVDFGLVHTLGDDGDDREKITRDGLIVGTPEYMSPEQASGGTLDGRSDLFSLGCVAYYLLTGKEAFNRGNAMKTLMAVVNEEATPATQINPFVPPDVAAVVARCMAKPQADRFQTAVQLDNALGTCECASRWSAERASDWWDRYADSRPLRTETSFKMQTDPRVDR
ncbi:MAG: protein kinase domain-containing protein [Fimbriiglobus sp.]